MFGLVFKLFGDVVGLNLQIRFEQEWGLDGTELSLLTAEPQGSSCSGGSGLRPKDVEQST
jgi:hypothetical protein